MRFRVSLFLMCCWLLPAGLLAQNVGIGTTQPTQKLDVNGNLRVRGLSGASGAVPVVQADGTLGTSQPLYSSTPQPYAPVPGSSVATGAKPYGIAADATLGMACVVNNTANTLQIFNIYNPASPSLWGTVATEAGPRQVAMFGTRAAVVTNTNALQFFECAIPDAPRQVSRIGIDASPNDVKLDATRAYVVSGNMNSSAGTLQVFNAANPAAPSLLGKISTNTAPMALAVNGTTVYVAGLTSLQIFDCASSTPKLLGSLSISLATDIVLVGNMAYISSGGDLSLVPGLGQLYAVDVSNPTAPRLVATVATNRTTFGRLAASTNSVYGVDWSTSTAGQLEVFRAMPDAFFERINNLTIGNGWDIAISGSYAYVVSSTSNKLTVYKLTEPPRAIAINADGSFTSVPLGDNLGNHKASQSLQLGPNRLTGTNPIRGLTIDGDGNVNVTGDLKPRTYSMQGSKLGNGSPSLAVYNWSHGLGYKPIVMFTVEGINNSVAQVTISYRHIDSNNIEIHMTNVGSGTTDFILHWVVLN